MFTLIDDGTLDTVVECGDCGQTERFDSASLLEWVEEDNMLDPSLEAIRAHLKKRNDMRVEAALTLAADNHECGPSPMGS